MAEQRLKQRRIPMESLMELLNVQMEKGGSARLTVTGCSMMPMLYNRRDTVTLIPADGKEKKGDVILYKREDGTYVLHRIIAVTEEGYICCGDNQYMREPVFRQQVLARVTDFTRKGKNVTVEKKSYKLYTSLWVGLFPLRRFYIPLRRYLGKVGRGQKYGESKRKEE